MARQPTHLRPAGVPTKREPDVSSKRYVRPDEERPAFVRQLEADGHAGLPVQREQLQMGVRNIPTPKKPSMPSGNGQSKRHGGTL